MKAILYILPVAMALGHSADAYEHAFERTAPGAVEVKKLPETKVLVAREKGSYFDNANRLFRRLFGYIKKNKVSMTVPVQAEMEPGAMMFFVGTKNAKQDLPDGDDVTVKLLPQRMVASYGARGGYSKKNYEATKAKLMAWLRENDGCEAIGDAYAIYWNSPFAPAFLKKYEVHIPVRLRQ